MCPNCSVNIFARHILAKQKLCAHMLCKFPERSTYIYFCKGNFAALSFAKKQNVRCLAKLQKCMGNLYFCKPLVLQGIYLARSTLQKYVPPYQTQTSPQGPWLLPDIYWVLQTVRTWLQYVTMVILIFYSTKPKCWGRDCIKFSAVHPSWVPIPKPGIPPWPISLNGLGWMLHIFFLILYKMCNTVISCPVGSTKIWERSFSGKNLPYLYLWGHSEFFFLGIEPRWSQSCQHTSLQSGK
jgi:hypothetical protein